jgi:ribonuclease J
MVRLTFYGGVNEIGGNKILIEDKGTRVILDFGMSYSDRRKFFIDPTLSSGDERDLLEFGILPAIDYDPTPWHPVMPV